MRKHEVRQCHELATLNNCKVNNKVYENDTVTDTWVKNFSHQTRTDAEMSVLKKSLNFTVSLDNLPIAEIITVIQSVRTLARVMQISSVQRLSMS